MRFMARQQGSPSLVHLYGNKVNILTAAIGQMAAPLLSGLVPGLGRVLSNLFRLERARFAVSGPKRICTL